MKVAGVLIGIAVAAVIAILVINKQKENAAKSGKESAPDATTENSPSPAPASASGSHPQFEASFRAGHGRDLWNLMIEVKIQIEMTEESVNGLKTVLQNQGLDLQGDSDFLSQSKHLAQIKRWQANLDQQYRKALVEFGKFRLVPSENLQASMDRTLSQGMSYAQKILNGKDPSEKVDSETVTAFKAGEGKSLWEKVQEVGQKIGQEEETLGKLKALLEDNGGSPDRDLDYSGKLIQVSKLKRWQGSLNGHFTAALLAYEKAKLGLGTDAVVKVEKSLMNGTLYAQKILNGEDPDYVAPALVVAQEPARHSARIVQIWQHLDGLKNMAQLPTAAELTANLGRANMRGFEHVRSQEIMKMTGSFPGIKSDAKLIWWAYFNGAERKRSVYVWFRENDQRLVGWHWVERVPASEQIGAPKGYADQAQAAFRRDVGSGLQGEVDAQLARAAEEKARLDEFGKPLNEGDADFKNFVKWRDAWNRLKSRTDKEPAGKLREAFLAHHKNRLLQSRAGEAAVRKKLVEGSQVVRAIWEEYQQAKVEVANPLPKLKVSIVGQVALALGQKTAYTSVFESGDPGVKVEDLGLTYGWYINRHGEKIDDEKHLAGRAEKVEHTFPDAGAYQVRFYVWQDKRLVASQAVNVNVVRPKKKAGQITVVNSSFGIVYIDIGQADTENGAKYTVRRGGQLVAQVIVGRLEPGKALCRLDKANSPGQPQVGDQVALIKN